VCWKGEIKPSATKNILLKINWIHIQKPVVTYDIVSFDRKTMCPDLFATLPNVFADENFKLFTNYCWYCLLCGNVIFES
jgi:hypothetical protein